MDEVAAKGAAADEVVVAARGVAADQEVVASRLAAALRAVRLCFVRQEGRDLTPWHDAGASRDLRAALVFCCLLVERHHWDTDGRRALRQLIELWHKQDKAEEQHGRPREDAGGVGFDEEPRDAASMVAEQQARAFEAMLLERSLVALTTALVATREAGGLALVGLGQAVAEVAPPPMQAPNDTCWIFREPEERFAGLRATLLTANPTRTPSHGVVLEQLLLHADWALERLEALAAEDSQQGLPYHRAVVNYCYATALEHAQGFPAAEDQQHVSMRDGHTGKERVGEAAVAKASVACSTLDSGEGGEDTDEGGCMQSRLRGAWVRTYPSLLSVLASAGAGAQVERPWGARVELQSAVVLGKSEAALLQSWDRSPVLAPLHRARILKARAFIAERRGDVQLALDMLVTAAKLSPRDRELAASIVEMHAQRGHLITNARVATAVHAAELRLLQMEHTDPSGVAGFEFRQPLTQKQIDRLCETTSADKPSIATLEQALARAMGEQQQCADDLERLDAVWLRNATPASGTDPQRNTSARESGKRRKG